MDQSKSSNPGVASKEVPAHAQIPMPSRSFSTEFFVGLFTMIGVAAAGYLSVGLGDLKIFGSSSYSIYADFENIAGLKEGASVEIAGVQVGEVTAISLNDPQARLTLSLRKGVQLRSDDLAAIRTKGVIGDRYVKIVRGASSTMLEEGQVLLDTESTVDIEDLVGNLTRSFGGGGQGFKLNAADSYDVFAEFDSIAGLSIGASVEIAGVQVGEVRGITFEDPAAIVTMRLQKDVQIRDDDIAAIRSKGLIGARYVRISRGGSEDMVPPNGKMTETESAVDFEDIIGKIIHSMTSGDEEEK